MNAPGGRAITTQLGQAAGITRRLNHVPAPRISRTDAMLARARANPTDWPMASEAAVRTDCFDAQTSQRQMIMQLTIISGT